MRQAILRIVTLLVVLASLSTTDGGSPASRIQTVPLTLTSGDPRFTTVEGGQGVVPSIEGFGTSSRPGEPGLPIRRLLVAIPEGSVPELRILGVRSEVLSGLDLLPAPRVRAPWRTPDARGAIRMRGGRADGRTPREDVQEYVEEYGRDPAHYRRDREFPAAPVRLGSIGYLRRQRFVEVLFTPLLYNPVRRQGRLFREVQAEVRFATPAPLPPAQPFRPDPYFEDAYRDILVNYEQAKSFGAAPEDLRGTGALPLTATSDQAPRPLEVTPGSPRYKIAVTEPAVYRLDHAYLGTRAPDLLALDPRTWILQAEGVEVPISIRDAAGGSGEADGVFNAGDVLEFFGRPKTTEPPTVLNHDLTGTTADVFQANDFIDTQIYWLGSAAPAGAHLRVGEVNGAPAMPGFPLASDFEATTLYDQNGIFIPLGPADPYFSLPSMVSSGAPAQRDVSLAIAGIAPVAGTATLTVRMRGGSDIVLTPDHRTQVWVNADALGGIDFTWDGEVIHEETFPIGQAVLTDPSTIHLRVPGHAGGELDWQYLDTITLQYRRGFAAVGGGLIFSYPNQDARFQITALGAAAPAIYEIGRLLPGSAEADAVRITGAIASGAPTSTYTFEVPQDTGPGAPAGRTFVVAGAAGLRLPQSMTRASDPVLAVPGNAADYLVIAARSVVETSPGTLHPALEALLAHRLATQGLTSRVVFIDQIYDEFSYGLRDANAIRSFLGWAYDNWTGPGGAEPPPSFVLLVGDATPDYKNTLNRGDWVDQVPTPIMFQQSSLIGYFSSDNLLASFRGADQIPDIHLGRISTRSVTSAGAVFDKILRYETMTPAGAWKGRGVLAAGDGRFFGEAASFEALNVDLQAAYFSALPFSAPATPLFYARPPWNESDAAGFRAALTSEIGAGTAYLTYVGHGNFDTWGLDGFYTTANASALTNGLRLPFTVIVNCLSGGFHSLLAGGALGEGMIANPLGGSIAVMAPSGLSNAFVGEVIIDEIFDAILGPARRTVLGPAMQAVRAELWSRNSIVDAQSYTFLGDPATVLATPAPAPPTALAASAGNARVDLSWVPPAGPVAGRRIYRTASDPAGLYLPIACDPLPATSCADLAVTNTTRYYYYAASFDADGFEGPASNLNADCDAGPGCVTALPLNPGPPAVPAGLRVEDAGSGGALLVSWNANPEPDLREYTIHFGLAAGSHPFQAVVQAGATSYTLRGLDNGVRYHLVLSATNTSDHESAPSAEVSGVPHLIEGIAPPRAISDLRLSVSGPDVVLDWSPVVVDIYGRPTVVAGYRVYRGTTPSFQPSPGTLLAAIAGGAVTTFRDAGAAVDPRNLYYLVTAEDAAGLVSGAGRDLPNGISDLAVELPAPDTVRLSWSAVTNDVQGAPTIIDHYEVHVTAMPVGRGSLGPATLRLDNVTALWIDLPMTTSPSFISVIAVDNRGNRSPL